VYIECSVGQCGNPTFSSGLCRKHYEQERLKSASPCSILGCTKSSYRQGLCSPHYRKQVRESHPLCTVPNCNTHQKTLSSGLCEKHLFRQTRHGSIQQPRAKDWGSREQHPLYNSYHTHKRSSVGMVAEWVSDFWVFAGAVGKRPLDHTLRKVNPARAMGPNNWEWKESESSADKAAYARQWRKNNPEKDKNNNLKKQYGITLGDYDAMARTQNGLCAICNNPEYSLDKDGGPRMMAVDHCHETGKVRALLCARCNKALGAFKDSPELLRKAALYIESFYTTKTIA